MVLEALWSFLSRIVEAVLKMLGLSSSPPSLGPPGNYLRVHVKYSGRTVQVDLDPGWSVGRVKEEIAPLLALNPKEIKIIFAGTELPDSFVLESCDVGQQSYLHAVRVLQVQQDSQTPTSLPNCPSSPPPHHSSRVTVDDDQNPSSPQSTPNLRTRTFSDGTEADELPASSPERTMESMDDQQPCSSASSVAAATRDNKESDFFVFCPECSDLKDGKLRVRCASCLSGAIEVDRPPHNWDDVLLPSRISGVCLDGCCSEMAFAQFYFKCTQHVTKAEDDSAPPLSLVKRNPEQVPCLACGDSKDVVVVFPCPLAHVTCVDCFKDYSLTRLNQREFIQDQDVGYTLGCPALCANSLIQDPHHFKLLGKYQYDRYQRFGTEECLLQMGGVFCPQPDCGMGIIPQDNNCDKIACLHGCEYVFCRKCLEGWHIGNCRTTDGQSPPAMEEDCSSGGYRSVGYFVSQDRAAAAQWGGPSAGGDATQRAMRLSTKPCPNCRVPTERAGGCMHMDCTKCKFEWCWVCQTKWTRECMGNHWFG